MALNSDRLSCLVLEAQQRIFRLAERDHGLSFKALSLDSGIAYNSIRNYAHGETVMAIPALLKLIGVIPDYLLSQLFEPVSKALIDTTNEDGDHDALAGKCIDFTSAYAKARHPQSPAGVEIAPCEDVALRVVARPLKGKAA